MDSRYSIQINGDSSDFLSVTLPDVLSKIKEGQMFKWAILWIYAVGDLGEPINMLDFEKQVNESSAGFAIEWNELMMLSSRFEQVIELILIGDKDFKNLKKYSTNDEMYNTCEYVIELIDSSCWIVHSTKEAGLQQMIRSLPGSQTLNM